MIPQAEDLTILSFITSMNVPASCSIGVYTFIHINSLRTLINVNRGHALFSWRLYRRRLLRRTETVFVHTAMLLAIINSPVRTEACNLRQWSGTFNDQNTWQLVLDHTTRIKQKNRRHKFTSRRTVIALLSRISFQWALPLPVSHFPDVTFFNSSNTKKQQFALLLCFSAGMETLQKDPLYGLDSRWSWIQVGFCCWTMFMSTMSVRASGVIFVGLIDFYNATREEASWPLTVHIATTSMGGISSTFSKNLLVMRVFLKVPRS